MNQWDTTKLLPEKDHQEIVKPRMLPVVEQYSGQKVKKQGTTFVARCPFHQEDTPSFVVYPNHAHCYGCNWHGDAIDFVQKIKDVDFKTALAELDVRRNDPDEWPD